jgi:hypothetical protein
VQWIEGEAPNEYKDSYDYLKNFGPDSDGGDPSGW